VRPALAGGPPGRSSPPTPLTWGVGSSRLCAHAHLHLSFGSRSGPSLPGRRTFSPAPTHIRSLLPQPHQHPACVGQGSGGRNHSNPAASQAMRGVGPPTRIGQDDRSRPIGELRSLHDDAFDRHAGAHELPKCDQQFAGKGDDRRLSALATAEPDALLEPSRQCRSRLVQQPEP